VDDDPAKGLGNAVSGGVHGSVVQAGVLHGDVHLTVTPAPASPPAPAQVPSESAAFVGRDSELVVMDQMAEGRDRLALMVVSGMGGTGKTALAAQWARQVADRFPDGILFAELAGHTLLDAISPEVVLAGFLLSIGVLPEQVPRTLADQRAMFRTLTAGRRMLVLLDNAATAAQVRVLLPGSGSSVVVVTTRWRLAGLAMEGARFLQLGPLDDESAALIVAGMAGGDRAAAEPEAVRDVVRLCGGLPLAVCVAGAQLVVHPRRPVSRLAADLASEQERLSRLALTDDISVISAFDISYRALSDSAARCYRLLSALFTPDFGTELATACCGVDAAPMLDELTGANLLEEIADNRFSFHDLLKLHARQQAHSEPDTVLAEATKRAIDWYLREAVRADRVLLPGRPRLNPMYQTGGAGHETDALEWLETELPGLVTAVHAAYDNGLHRAAWQLCEAMVGLFSHRKHFSQWIDTSQVGIASAVACADQQAESAMRIRLGLAYLGSGQTEQAAVQFGLALDVARQAGYRLGEASALEHLGLICLRKGEPEPAAGYFRDALAIYRALGRSRGVMLMTRCLGEASRDAGRYGEAISKLSEARTLAVEMNEPYHEMQCLLALGKTYARAAMVPLALTTLQEALLFANRVGARHELARILEALAGAELAAGDLVSAREHVTSALAVYSEIAAPEAKAASRLLAELQ
jgi:tetratricopeptide (TPR) repeat protein